MSSALSHEGMFWGGRDSFRITFLSSESTHCVHNLGVPVYVLDKSCLSGLWSCEVVGTFIISAQMEFSFSWNPNINCPVSFCSRIHTYHVCSLLCHPRQGTSSVALQTFPVAQKHLWFCRFHWRFSRGDRGRSYSLNPEKPSLDVLFFRSLLSEGQHMEVSVCGWSEQSSRAVVVPFSLLGCSLRLWDPPFLPSNSHGEPSTITFLLNVLHFF